MSVYRRASRFTFSLFHFFIVFELGKTADNGSYNAATQ